MLGIEPAQHVLGSLSRGARRPAPVRPCWGRGAPVRTRAGLHPGRSCVSHAASWWNPAGRGTAANEVTPGVREHRAYGSRGLARPLGRARLWTSSGARRRAPARLDRWSLETRRTGERAVPGDGGRRADLALLDAAVRAVGGSPARASRRWPRPSPTRSTTASTCSSRPAPAPASRWPTSCRRSRTPSPPATRRRRDRHDRAAAPDRRPRPAPARRRARAAARPPRRRTRSSRAGATTCAGTRSSAASPTTTTTRCSTRARARTDRRRRAARARSCGCASGRDETDDRRPRRARPGRRRPGLAAGVASPRASASARPECPYGAECFAELARERAHEVPTSSSPTTRCSPSTPRGLRRCCPSTTCVVVDEAHELVDRVTGVATDELTAGMVERGVAARGQAGVDDDADGPGRRRGGARGGARRRCPRAGCRRACPRSWPPRWPLVRDAARDVLSDDRRTRPSRTRTTARASWPGPRSTRCTTSPSGSPRTRRYDVDVGVAHDPRRGRGRCASRRCRSPGCCARRCSASARWC